MVQKDNQLNKRQDMILSFVIANKTVSSGKIVEYVRQELGDVTRVTVTRDLSKLINLGFVIRKGSGRSSYYEVSPRYSLVRKIDAEAYFSIDSDKREILGGFNFDIFDQLGMGSIFTDTEKSVLAELNRRYERKIAIIPDDVFKKEMERLVIDFSWKSSKIEGNTYDLLETEQLIKNQQQAVGHTQEEATMILNHKAALEYIREHKDYFQSISLKKMEDIHTLLIQEMGITKGLRKTLVRITGTKYMPIDNEFQIREAVEKECDLVNKIPNPFEKAVVSMLLTAYIQPFTDGNKRTSRIVGNAILQSFDCCPLSYRSMDEVEYKKAILLFYEQNNITYFKELFLSQFAFAVDNYFG